MFQPNDIAGYLSPIAGVRQKTLVYGDNLLMTQFMLDKGAVLPRHSHPQEQTGYLISGRIRLFIDGDVHDCGPGDSWCIPGDATHGADILEEAVAIEIFSPVREDYLPSK